MQNNLTDFWWRSGPCPPERPRRHIEAIGRVQALHARANYHGIDLAMARIEDGSGIWAAALPMTGRSKEHIVQTATQTGFLLGLPPAALVGCFVAAEVEIVSCAAPWRTQTLPIGCRVRKKIWPMNYDALASKASTCLNGSISEHSTTKLLR